MYVKHRLPADARVSVDQRNRRVKLVDCGKRVDSTIAAVVAMAERSGLEKVWGFVSMTDWMVLSQLGFVREGTLDGYFPDGPGVGVARYLSGERRRSQRSEEEDAIVARAIAEAGAPMMKALPVEYTVRPAARDDCAAISRVLTAVFTSYPTPIDSAEAIARAMDRNVCFTLAEHDGRVISVAAADIDRAHRVAEMTDCATLPAHRGRGLMHALLAVMEAAIRARGLRSLFTLARATSPAINVVFARLGYHCRGRFINNCHIAGSWEDMNLWVKPL